jgi:hypothetical protein
MESQVVNPEDERPSGKGAVAAHGHIQGALMAIGAIPNFISQSRWENFIFGPLGLALAVLCVVVARSPAPAPSQPKSSDVLMRDLARHPLRKIGNP